MSLAATLPTSTMYPGEPKTYISTTTIKLKPSTLHAMKVGGGTMVFEWHTNVNTPPNTPVVKKPVVEESIESSTQGENLQSGLPMRGMDLFLPAHTFDETDDLKTNLDKFMSCERYHSQYLQMYQQGTNL